MSLGRQEKVNAERLDQLDRRLVLLKQEKQVDHSKKKVLCMNTVIITDYQKCYSLIVINWDVGFSFVCKFFVEM